MIDREEFAKYQAEMGSKWNRDVLARESDYQSYIEKRHVAYLDRWMEAARFIPQGARILDIGGGNSFRELMQFFVSRNYDYWYVDIEPGSVTACQALATEVGLKPAQFSAGFNDKFSFEDGFFDAIFSSHCVEHSFDLSATFSELWRMLKVGGNLLMAVPFGWEENPAHPYFFGPDEWIALVEDAGFEIRVAQIGKEYPEEGYDYFIAARKVDKGTIPSRIDPNAFTKSNFKFMRFDDPSIGYVGTVALRDDHALCEGLGWDVFLSVPAGVSSIIPIFSRHAWSGVIEMRCREAYAVVDLFSWFKLVLPSRLALPNPLQEESLFEIRAIDRNPVSRSSQCVLMGIMFAVSP